MLIHSRTLHALWGHTDAPYGGARDIEQDIICLYLGSIQLSCLRGSEERHTFRSESVKVDVL